MYAAQDKEVRARILSCTQLQGVKVGTIDSYQGKEDDIIIFLTTRSTGRSGSFLCNPHRINVMLSRHKLGIIGIGTEAMLQCHPHWPEIVADFSEGGLNPNIQIDHSPANATSEVTEAQVRLLRSPPARESLSSERDGF